MKILVAAKVLRLDRTAEGICSSKFLITLARAGHDVTCLTNDRLDASEGVTHAAWLPSVRIIPLSAVSSEIDRAWTVSRLRAHGKAARYGAGKIDVASACLTGYNCETWEEVRRWHLGIHRAIKAEQPDVIITRGAGTNLTPHMALAQSGSPVPWIAHYHDPYPISLFPDPYRHWFPLVSRRQEAVHFRILRAADALTFPCERLLRWVLTGDLERHRRKAFVVPHVAGDLPTASPSAAPSLRATDARHFLVIHSGSLLRQRNPRALVEGFLAFVREQRERARNARLVFVGRIDKAHEGFRAWDELRALGTLVRVDERVDYGQALALVRSAAAGVIVEAQAQESPVMVAKLADYLWLRRPILALSPANSGTADILGRDYPLLVSPTDAGEVTAAIRLLWSHWEAGTLEKLVPPYRVLQPLMEGPVQTTMAAACRTARDVRRQKAA